MSTSFARLLVVHTIASVTGDNMDEVADESPHAVDARDWDQILSRLEALADADLGFWRDRDRVIDVDALAQAVQAHAGPLVDWA